jgi:hypothetical protein
MGSDAGGEMAVVLYSFVATCQRHGIDVFVYLRDIFRRLTTQSADRLAELLPDHWQPLSVDGFGKDNRISKHVEGR